MKLISIADACKYNNSNQWYDEEVTGVLMELSPTFDVFQNKSVKCLIASGNESIKVLVRSDKVTHLLDKERHRLAKIKLTLNNFQKSDGILKTGKLSTIELDDEDLPPVNIETTNDMLYADTVDIPTVPYLDAKNVISITGIARKIDCRPHAPKPHAKLEVEDKNSGQFVRVTLFEEKLHLVDDLSERQEVTVYDVVTRDRATDDKYKGLALSTLTNTASTTVKLGTLITSEEQVQLLDVLTYNSSDRYYDQTVSGRLITVSSPFKVRNVDYMKCVIGEGRRGMLVMIKGHTIIQRLARQQLDEPLKISLSTFQVKDNTITVEAHSGIEIDDEVKNVKLPSDVPEVTNAELIRLLHAPVANYTDCKVLKVGTRISVQGRIRQLWQDDNNDNATMIVEDSDRNTIRITFWRDQRDITQQLEIGQKYWFYDLKVGNPDFKGSATAIADSTMSTSIKEHVTSEYETSPAKLTGVNETQVVARVGTKRMLFYCDEDLRNEIQDIIPKKVHIKYSDDKLLSYEIAD